MGEIVDLERYRKLRRRREAGAKEVKRGDASNRDKAEPPCAEPPCADDPCAPAAVKQAGPGHSGSKGATESSDDPKTD